MNLLRRAAAIAAGTVLCSGLFAAVPAAADVTAAACKTTSTRTVSNEAVKATGRTVSCSTNETSWVAKGTLYDTNADNRSVYLKVMTIGSGGKVVSTKTFKNSKGRGTSVPWSLTVNKKYKQVKIRARACNTWGCGKYTGSELLHRYLN